MTQENEKMLYIRTGFAFGGVRNEDYWQSRFDEAREKMRPAGRLATPLTGEDALRDASVVPLAATHSKPSC